jgi:hypothetical protein
VRPLAEAVRGACKRHGCVRRREQPPASHLLPRNVSPR